MATAALLFDQCDLRRTRRGRHHRDERQPKHGREVRLGDRCRSRRRLDHGGVLADPAVAERVEEQGPRQPVLETARDVRRLVLEVQLNVDARTPRRRQRIAQQMRVGATSRVGLDQSYGVVHPLAWPAAIRDAETVGHRAETAGWDTPALAPAWPPPVGEATSVNNVASGLQQNRRGAYGEVPMPADTCSRVCAPHWDGPLA